MKPLLIKLDWMTKGKLINMCICCEIKLASESTLNLALLKGLIWSHLKCRAVLLRLAYMTSAPSVVHCTWCQVDRCHTVPTTCFFGIYFYPVTLATSLVIVSFPRLVYLATRGNEWYSVHTHTHTRVTCLSNMHDSWQHKPGLVINLLKPSGFFTYRQV